MYDVAYLHPQIIIAAIKTKMIFFIFTSFFTNNHLSSASSISYVS